eukprot:jgi/Botrbrau1/912/Bobra.0167s0027.2
MLHDLQYECRALRQRMERDRWLLTQDSFHRSPFLPNKPTAGGSIGLPHPSSAETIVPPVHRMFDAVDSSEDSDHNGVESERRAVARHWGRVWKARAGLKSRVGQLQKGDVEQMKGQMSLDSRWGQQRLPLLGENSAVDNYLRTAQSLGASLIYDTAPLEPLDSKQWSTSITRHGTLAEAGGAGRDRDRRMWVRTMATSKPPVEALADQIRADLKNMHQADWGAFNSASLKKYLACIPGRRQNVFKRLYKLPAEVADKKAHLERRASREAARKALLARHREFKLSTSTFIATPPVAIPGASVPATPETPHHLRHLPTFDGIKARYNSLPQPSADVNVVETAACPLPRSPRFRASRPRRPIARNVRRPLLKSTNLAPLAHLLTPLWHPPEPNVGNCAVPSASDVGRAATSHGTVLGDDVEAAPSCEYSSATQRPEGHRESGASVLQHGHGLGYTSQVICDYAEQQGPAWCRQRQKTSRSETTVLQNRRASAGKQMDIGPGLARKQRGDQSGAAGRFKAEAHLSGTTIAAANPSLAGPVQGGWFPTSLGWPEKTVGETGQSNSAIPGRPVTCPARVDVHASNVLRAAVGPLSRDQWGGEIVRNCAAAVGEVVQGPEKPQGCSQYVNPISRTLVNSQLGCWIKRPMPLEESSTKPMWCTAYNPDTERPRTASTTATSRYTSIPKKISEDFWCLLDDEEEDSPPHCDVATIGIRAVSAQSHSRVLTTALQALGPTWAAFHALDLTSITPGECISSKANVCQPSGLGVKRGSTRPRSRARLPT